MITRYTRLLFTCCFLLTATAASAQVADKPTPVWPGAVPDSVPTPAETSTPQPVNPKKGGLPVIKVTNVSTPTIQVFHPAAALDKHAAVIVFPGGGFQFMAFNLEGTEICSWLNSQGITAVLLKYRVPAPVGGQLGKLPLEDAQRAMGLVRQQAPGWGVDPKKVGVIGFSAGGVLAALLSTHPDRTYPHMDAADDLPSRPDFAMVIYPGAILEKGTNNKITSDFPVTAATPTTFLVQAENDALIDNSVAYFLTLQGAGVAAELHIFATGGHGFGLRPSADPVSHWPELAATWLHTIHVIQN